MSEILILGLRIGLLVLLWGFILLIANVIRRDMFGHAVPVSELESAQNELAKPVKPKKHRGKQVTGTPRALAVVEGRQAGLEIPLVERLTIGRAPGSVLVLDDDYASTHHAVIFAQARGQFYVEDAGSTNGTYVNGSRITVPTAFGLDDSLRIGHTTMRLVA